MIYIPNDLRGGLRGWGGGGAEEAECLTWQLEIVRMSCDTTLQHPQPRPVIQAACQSVSQSARLFTLVLLTRVSARSSVVVFILGRWIWEKWQRALALCQSPSGAACVSALLTDALVLPAKRRRLQMWDMSRWQPTRQADAQTGHEQSSLTWGGGHPPRGEAEWNPPWSVHSWKSSLPHLSGCSGETRSTSINNHPAGPGTVTKPDSLTWPTGCTLNLSWRKVPVHQPPSDILIHNSSKQS